MTYEPAQSAIALSYEPACNAISYELLGAP